MANCPDAWLVHAGSGLAYGRSGRLGRPLHEGDAMEPMDAYGASKAAGDLALGALAEEGLRVARMRPFNSIGAGQTVDFAIPAFASQIAAIEAGRQDPVLSVGNLEAERDFLDVSDVTAAYAAVIRRSGDLGTGRAFNVASGRAVVMRDMLDMLLAMTERSIDVVPDPARQRPSDLSTISGDSTRLRTETGWTPRADLEATLRGVLDHERRRIRAYAT
jgi:GDP-4-dehydro-6-deoxy-D-mannose reductase